MEQMGAAVESIALSLSRDASVVAVSFEGGAAIAAQAGEPLRDVAVRAGHRVDFDCQTGRFSGPRLLLLRRCCYCCAQIQRQSAASSAKCVCARWRTCVHACCIKRHRKPHPGRTSELVRRVQVRYLRASSRPSWAAGQVCARLHHAPRRPHTIARCVMSLVRSPADPPPSQSTWCRCVSATPARRAACRAAARFALMSPAGASRPRLSPLASHHNTTQQRALHSPSSSCTSPTDCSEARIAIFPRSQRWWTQNTRQGFGWSLMSRRERMHILSRWCCACDDRRAAFHRGALCVLDTA